MLLVFFRAIVAARKRQDEGIITLEFAEPAWGARMIGLLIVRGEQRAVFVYQIESYRYIPMAELASLQCVSSLQNPFTTNSLFPFNTLAPTLTASALF